MKVPLVVVFQLIALFSCNDAQLFGGMGAQLQAAQLQQAQLQQARLQQAQLQHAAMLQQQMGGMNQLGQQQGQSGRDEEDDEARKGKGGFGGWGFGRFRPSFGFNPFFPGFGGFGGLPGFGGFGGLGGLGGLGGMNMGLGGFGMNPFGGMFGRTTNQMQSGLSAGTGTQQTNQQLQQFMDQMNARFNQREQNFDRMKDDFLIELGQKLKEQYGSQVTEAEVQLYLKNVDEQLRTMYGNPQSNSDSRSDGNSGTQLQGQSAGLRNPFRQAQDSRNGNGRSAAGISQRNLQKDQQVPQWRVSNSP